MKIALVLSGNLRTFDAQCKKNNDKISNNYKIITKELNLDTFCYTDTNDFIYNEKYHVIKDNQYINKKFSEKYDTIYKSHDECNKYIQDILYNTFEDHLKKINIEKFNDTFLPYNKENKYHKNFFETNTGRNINGKESKNSLLHESYKRYMAYNLLVNYEKENNFKYDLIIYSRFDCFPIGIEKINLNNIDFKRTIIIKQFPCFVCGVGLIGNRFIMDKYFNYYNYIAPNLIDNIFAYWKGNKISNIKKEGYIDISDSSEYGYTYLFQNIHKYKCKDYGINFRGFLYDF